MESSDGSDRITGARLHAPASGGGDVSLSSFRGRPVVLAFLRGYS